MRRVLFFRQYLMTLLRQWGLALLAGGFLPQLALVGMPLGEFLATAVSRWRRCLVLAMVAARRALQADMKMGMMLEPRANLAQPAPVIPFHLAQLELESRIEENTRDAVVFSSETDQLCLLVAPGVVMHRVFVTVCHRNGLEMVTFAIHAAVVQW